MGIAGFWNTSLSFLLHASPTLRYHILTSSRSEISRKMNEVRTDSGSLAAIRRLAFKVEQMAPPMAALCYCENDALKCLWDYVRIESFENPTSLSSHYIFFLTS